MTEDNYNDPRFLEDVIIKFLFTKQEIRDKLMAFVTDGLFDRKTNIDIIKFVMEFKREFDSFPSYEDFRISTKTSEEATEHLKSIMLIDLSPYTGDNLIKSVEEYFREKLINRICMDTVMSLSSETGVNKTAADELRNAMCFSFDTTIGMDVIGESDRYYDFIHLNRKFVPSSIPTLNKLIDGGYPAKELTMYVAATNVGKSLIMTSEAAANTFENRNVLYITCEMSEEKIAERFWANSMNVPINKMKFLDKTVYDQKVNSVKRVAGGTSRFIIKEYPPRKLNCNLIRNLLADLSSKKKFVPDILYVDYIGLMVPTSVSKNANTAEALKIISEELRAIAVEYNIPVVTASQLNREGMKTTKVDLDHIAEAIGMTHTAGIIIGVEQPDELIEAGKYRWSILKNRNGPKKKWFTVKVDYDYMRISHDEDSAGTADIPDDSVPENAHSHKKSVSKVQADRQIEEASDFVSGLMTKKRTINNKSVEGIT